MKKYEFVQVSPCSCLFRAESNEMQQERVYIYMYTQEYK